MSSLSILRISEEKEKQRKSGIRNIEQRKSNDLAMKEKKSENLVCLRMVKSELVGNGKG